MTWLRGGVPSSRYKHCAVSCVHTNQRRTPCSALPGRQLFHHNYAALELSSAPWRPESIRAGCREVWPEELVSVAVILVRARFGLDGDHGSGEASEFGVVGGSGNFELLLGVDTRHNRARLSLK